MGGAFNFNGCKKLEKNSFNNILAMKISFVFEFNSTNSSSGGTNLGTFRFYQNLARLDGSGEIRKGKKKFERKRKRYKPCREEMDITEEVKIVGLLL